VLIARTSGSPSVEGFESLRAAVLAHPAFRPGMDVLYDHTGLTGGMTSGEVRATAEGSMRASQAGDYWGRLAIVVPDRALFGLARMWEAYAGDELAARTRVFSSRDEALDWFATR
jgi:hypothetical protein